MVVNKSIINFYHDRRKSYALVVLADSNDTFFTEREDVFALSFMVRRLYRASQNRNCSLSNFFVFHTSVGITSGLAFF